MLALLRQLHRPLSLTALVGALAVLCVAAATPGGATAPGAARGVRATAHAIALAAGGDYSNVGFDSAFSDMDPAMAAFAARFVPTLRSVSDFEAAQAGPPGAASGAETDYSAANVLALSWEAARLVNASIPVSSQGAPAARPLRLRADPEDHARAVECLAQAVYYEAAYEPAEGQAAVAQVVLNRMRHPLYPKTVCGVVYQGHERATGCQFTFTCDGALARAPVEPIWGRARQAAERALAGYVVKSVGTATHYHADYVVPYWIPSLAKLTKVGTHIFYRWSGGMGLTGAFTGAYAGGEPLVGPARVLAAAEDRRIAKVVAELAPVTQPKPIQLAATAPLDLRRAEVVLPAADLDLKAPALAPQRTTQGVPGFRPHCVASTLGNCPF